MDASKSLTLPSFMQSREVLEQCIEFLIEHLDRFDPDPDLEAGDDLEPNLADSSTDLEKDESDYEPYLSAGAVYWTTSGYSGGFDYEQEAGDPNGLIYGGNEAVMALAPYKVFV